MGLVVSWWRWSRVLLVRPRKVRMVPPSRVVCVRVGIIWRRSLKISCIINLFHGLSKSISRLTVYALMPIDSTQFTHHHVPHTHPINFLVKLLYQLAIDSY